MPIIFTERLKLRQWQESDRDGFAELVADPAVMRFFPSTLDRSGSDALIDRLSGLIEEHGHGFWAAERRDTSDFIGFIGINHIPAETMSFAPNTDVGWRLARKHWGQGYATEGALASLDYGFTKASLDEIVAMCPVGNIASESVMKKVGLRNCNANFKHPKLPVDHPLSEHVLYRVTREQWQAKRPQA